MKKTLSKCFSFLVMPLYLAILLRFIWLPRPSRLRQTPEAR